MPLPAARRLQMSSLTRRDLIRAGVVASVASMEGPHPLFAVATEDGATIAPRERLLMDFGWKFQFGHGTDPARDLGFGVKQDDFSKAGEFKFATEKWDDSKWRPLNLPHDWAVELPFARDENLQSHGYKPLGRSYPETSVGWYRKTFELPESDRGRRLLLDFDGAFRDTLIFLNGYFIGRNDNGYAPFTFNISDFANYGGKNYLVARVDASFGDGWFYEGAGIYRHIWVTKTDELHFGQWESYVRTPPKQTRGTAGSLDLGTIVRNEGMTAQTCSVRWELFDASRNIVAKASSTSQTIPPDGSATFTAGAN